MQLTVNTNHSMLERETTPSYMLPTDNIRATSITTKHDYTEPP